MEPSPSSCSRPRSKWPHGPLGCDVRFHVPHRLREGYGMKSEVIEAAAAAGARLIISVDTGIRAFAAAEAAATLGIDLIVTDHHLPDATRGLPPALAVLNPNRADCAYACKHLCGAGVAFKLSQALLEAHDLERARTKILPSFLKLLAIATIADAVPLLGENRAIAALGIQQLAHPAQSGLRALLELAKLDPPRTTPDLDRYRLSPRSAHQRRRTHGHRLRGRRDVHHPRSAARPLARRKARSPQLRSPQHRGRRPRRDRSATQGRSIPARGRLHRPRRRRLASRRNRHPRLARRRADRAPFPGNHP